MSPLVTGVSKSILVFTSDQSRINANQSNQNNENFYAQILVDSPWEDLYYDDLFNQ